MHKRLAVTTTHALPREGCGTDLIATVHRWRHIGRISSHQRWCGEGGPTDTTRSCCRGYWVGWQYGHGGNPPVWVVGIHVWESGEEGEGGCGRG